MSKFFSRNSRPGRARTRRNSSHRPTAFLPVEQVESRQLLTSIALRPDVLYAPEVVDVEVRDSAEAARLREELAARLIDNAVEQYRDLLGTNAPWWYGWGGYYLRSSAEFATGGLNIAASSPSADASDTNNQEAGVDEADLVETDGQFLYLISGRTLSIVENLEGGLLQERVSLELPGQAHGIFLNGNVLTVISQWVPPNIHPGYEWAAPSRVAVSVFDISDRDAPSLTGQTIFDGYYRTARQVGDHIYVAVQNSGPYAPSPEIIPLEDEVVIDPAEDKRVMNDGLTDDFVIEDGAIEDVVVDDVIDDEYYIDDEVFDGELVEVDPTDAEIVTDELIEIDDSGFGSVAGGASRRLGFVADEIFFPERASGRYQTEAEYRATLEEYFRTVAIPQSYTVQLEGDVPVLVGESLIADADLYLQTVTESPWYYGGQLTSVVSIDTRATQNAVVEAVTTTGYPEIYMTGSSLYLFGYNYGGYAPSTTDALVVEPDSTLIERFDFTDGDFGDAIRGTVPGRVLNSFALDEADGYLRIATTTGFWRDAESAVYVLQEQDGALAVVGSVTGIGVGQQMFAARFIDSRAYLITFQQVDPLHVIDLSDPLNPTELGELEIPGFSNYLQPLDENHLIGIGRDAENNLQVSLFDISDPTNPLRVSEYSFKGSWNTYSDATFDHHAVSLFAEQGKLVIPLQSWNYEFDDDGNFIDLSEKYFAVLNVDPVNGISLAGEVDHETTPLRSLRIGDVLFTVSETVVRSNDLDDVSLQIDELAIGDVFEEPIAYPLMLSGLAELRTLADSVSPNVRTVSVAGAPDAASPLAIPAPFPGGQMPVSGPSAFGSGAVAGFPGIDSVPLFARLLDQQRLQSTVGSDDGTDDFDSESGPEMPLDIEMTSPEQADALDGSDGSPEDEEAAPPEGDMSQTDQASDASGMVTGTETTDSDADQRAGQGGNPAGNQPVVPAAANSPAQRPATGTQPADVRRAAATRQPVAGRRVTLVRQNAAEGSQQQTVQRRQSQVEQPVSNTTSGLQSLMESVMELLLIQA